MSDLKIVALFLVISGFGYMMVERYIESEINLAIYTERMELKKAYDAEMDKLRLENQTLVSRVKEREEQAKKDLEELKKESDKRFKEIESEWNKTDNTCETKLKLLTTYVDDITQRMFRFPVDAGTSARSSSSSSSCGPSGFSTELLHPPVDAQTWPD